MRILIVEDEKKIASFIQRGLKEEGYATDVAHDGEKGHFLASTNDYDLIIMDVMLPKVDGVDLCRMLRKGDVTVPIIMLTAKDRVEDKVAGLDAGANDYVTKPFAFEELSARIRAHLRSDDQKEITQLICLDLTLDLLSHNVARSDKEISLTNKEFALLEYFLRHKGRVVTRTMISEHVWDIHFDTDTNIIDVYVSHLRTKINKGHDVKLIQTVRGRGYILKNDEDI